MYTKHIGRYTDAYKTKQQTLAWQASADAYLAGDKAAAYHHFFKYLRDDETENVVYTFVQTDAADYRLDFVFYQGSKQIFGHITPDYATAVAKVVGCPDTNIGVLRRLLARNAHLLYTAFCLDAEQNICIRFSSNVVDLSPQKLYFALKELALSADKQDDLLLHEFPTLVPIDNRHVQLLEATTIADYFAFFRQWLDNTSTLLAALERKRNNGLMAFVLLELAYKIDALLQPEGFIMETCDRMHQIYFDNSSATIAKKVIEMRHELDVLLSLSANDLEKEMYRTHTTFSITRAAKAEQVRAFIKEQLPHLVHYKAAESAESVQAVIGFIVGACYFNYAPPKAIRAVLDVWYKVSEPIFALHAHSVGIPFTAADIKAQLAFLEQKHGISMPISTLSFDSINDFGESLLRALLQSEDKI